MDFDTLTDIRQNGTLKHSFHMPDPDQGGHQYIEHYKYNGQYFTVVLAHMDGEQYEDMEE